MGIADKPLLPVRVASVSYLNAAPLTCALDPARYTVTTGHPSEIAAMLHRREVDVALVPVAAVLDDLDLRIVPGVAIGADGPVDSVLLVGELPPAQWTEVLLDGASRTSAALTQVLLRARPELRVQVRPVAAGTGPAQASGTVATLVIGDAARELPARFAWRLDLAQMWKDQTGLPFVFAVWAGRPGLDPQVVDDLRAAAAVGLAERAARWSGDDLTYLTERIRYELSDRQLMGLRRFAALAASAGLVRHDHVHLYPPPPRPPAAHRDDLLLRAIDGERLSPSDLAQLADLPVGDLAVAAALCRSARFGAIRVTHAHDAPVLPAEGPLTAVVDAALGLGRPFLAPSLTALARLADAAGRAPSDVVGALLDAGLRGFAGDPAGDDPTVLAGVLASLPPTLPVQLSYRADGDLGRLADLLALAARFPQVTGICVAGAMPAGVMVHGDAPTPVASLRAVAIARLGAPTGHVSVHLPTFGPDIAQIALRSGADDLGPTDGPAPDLGCATWSVSVSEAERMIRAAGFEPAVRDASFRVISAAVTRPEHIRRAGIVARR